MLQVLQNLGNGQTMLEEVPVPAVSSGKLLIRTESTLISAGTEKMLVEFGKAGWLGKAKAQPEKVKQVLDKIRTDGLLPTLEAVFTKLGEPLPLGYCNAGTVVDVGAGVTEFQIGDRVVSNGPHAGFVSVPKNLCARIPEGVPSEEAAFTVLASIGLQGIRLAAPTLGESIVVYGLGLIGLITVQLLRANGCHVIGIDIHPERLKLARDFGAETIHGLECNDIGGMVHHLTQQRGADAVLITASAKSDDIVRQAAKACRKRGRIVLVGVVGLQLNRSDFYEKELSFQVSCSYGPGRYDASYEEAGNDYPIGFVRWTEQRNFEAILQMLGRGQISFSKLLTHRYPIDQAIAAYETIQKNPNSLGVLLEFPQDTPRTQTLSIAAASTTPSPLSTVTAAVTAAVIGAGNFTRATLLPAVKGLPVRWKYVAGRSTPSEVQHTAKKFGFERATTDLSEVLSDPEVHLVFITTNHDSHAQLICRALEAGKHVFVEKPLAINREQLDQVIASANSAASCKLIVGFNRRFSPHTLRCKELLRGRTGPVAMQIMINAGSIPANHWVHDPLVGGGRIIGEACHFLDWMSYVTDSDIRSVSASQLAGGEAIHEDKMTINVTLADGSIGNLCYFANGSKAYPKETYRVFSDDRVLEIDNFRVTHGYGFKGFRRFKTTRQEKGHKEQFASVVQALQGKRAFESNLSRYINTTLASFAAVESAATDTTITHLA